MELMARNPCRTVMDLPMRPHQIGLHFAKQCLLLLALSAISFAASASQCKTSSGQYKTALIELYTSEGCSSCPPADSWLRRLPKQDYAGSKVIPLSFHVDYWDYLGWSDRFAKKQYTQRQRRVASVNRLNTIYTPQVVIDGHDFRFWFWAGRTKSKISDITRMPAQARIELTVKKTEGNKITATSNVMLLPQSYPKQSSVFIALYQNKLTSRIRAGENKGRELKHDFVVRDLRGPFNIDGNSVKKIEQDFYLDKSWNPANIGIAVFVQNRNNGEILQALSSEYCS